MLDILAKASDAEHARDLLPEVHALVRRRLATLKRGRIPPEKLIVRQTLSRELDAHHSPSPTVLAARQLAEYDKNLRLGHPVRFVYTLGKPGVSAWVKKLKQAGVPFTLCNGKNGFGLMDVPFCLGEKALESLSRFCQDRGLTAFMLVADGNTYPLPGRHVRAALHGHDWDVKSAFFSEPELIPEVRVRRDCTLGGRNEKTTGGPCPAQ
jgi:hypothetical protein